MNRQNKKQVDLLRLAAAGDVKLGKSQISQYLSGKAVPRDAVGRFLAETLQVNVDWLYGSDKKMDAKSDMESLKEDGMAERGKGMREFVKSSKLDNVLYDVREPVVDEAIRMEENGMNVLKLNIGNPAPFGFRTPDYPLWTACVTLAGGKAVHYIFIFSDEIYDRLVMDEEEHVSIASLAPDLFCVTFSGLSMSHMIAGFRIGWMVLSGNKKIAKDYIEGLNMLSNMRLCSNVPAQSIVQTALGVYQSVNSYIVPGGRIYEQRE